MSKFGSKEDIVKAIESHFTRMQTGKMSMEDLEELVEQSRELYERVLVLRYKAYEEKVFGEAKEVLGQHETAPASFATTETVEAENEAEEQMEHPEAQIETTGEPVFDFSLFDEPAESHPEHNGPAENTSENYREPETQEEEEKTQFVTLDTDLPYDSEVTAEIHTPEINEPAPAPVSYQEDLFKDILSKDDPSRMMGSKLDTLVGAFGFNEKFQSIQELFKGSTEDFNQAIDVLDNMQTLEEAMQQLQFYVRLNSWDLESEITAEFVRKVERRFR
ncbi:MAG: hypothetical protein ACO1O6_08485 [Bacteroidota bacterium]